MRVKDRTFSSLRVCVRSCNLKIERRKKKYEICSIEQKEDEQMKLVEIVAELARGRSLRIGGKWKEKRCGDIFDDSKKGTLWDDND